MKIYNWVPKVNISHSTINSTRRDSPVKRVVVSNIPGFTASDPSTLVVDPSHVHPSSKLYSVYKLTPETIVQVYTCGFLETTDYLRCFFKEADILLKVGGNIVIDYYSEQSPFLRNHKLLMYEFSLAVGKRYQVSSKIQLGVFTRVILEKCAPTLPDGDSMEKWSFGLLTDGRMNEKTLQTIDEVNDLGIPQYEFLICGPDLGQKLPPNVRMVEDVPADRAGRGPISAKKNRLIESARYNNLALFHQRIGFGANWYRGMRDYGNYFEVLSTRTLDNDDPSLVVSDWLYTEGDFTDYRAIKFGRLSYDEWSPHVRMNGGYIVAKKHIIESILFDERLHQNEYEDIHWSRMLYLSGVVIAMNPLAPVTSLTYRIKGDVPIKKHAAVEGREPSFLRKMYRKTGIFRLIVNVIRQQRRMKMNQKEKDAALMAFSQQVDHQNRIHSAEYVESVKGIRD